MHHWSLFWLRFAAVLVVVAVWSAANAVAESQFNGLRREAQHELDVLRDRVADFDVVALPARPGRVTLTRKQSLTVEMLRGVVLDDRPPVVGQPDRPYDPRFTDQYPPGGAPYVAAGIEPFRFRYFDCEFRYAGWYNNAMVDYASAHGFNVLISYGRSANEKGHHPAGTHWTSSKPNVVWDRIIRGYEVAADRYDRFADQAGVKDLVQLAVKAGAYQRPSDQDTLMIDIEHGCLSPDQLDKQAWFKAVVAGSDRATAAADYYRGHALSFLIPIAVARAQGWPEVSLYGWNPFPRMWQGLEDEALVHGETWRWEAYGRDVYAGVDLVHPSVYCFYWDARNVAYTLANIDLNMALVGGEAEVKPVRPYYWVRMHGGGGGDRWWRGQPLPSEEVRAMIALGFFTGVDGVVLWDWSEQKNFHRAPRLTRIPNDIDRSPVRVMLREGMTLAPIDGLQGSAETVFQRYDVLEIVELDRSGMRVVFERIPPDSPGNRGNGPRARYAIAKDELSTLLRPNSEAVSAVFEGMALVRPLEYILRHGEVEVDVDARDQFAKSLPIVRRVRLGPIHVIATYDPDRVHGGEARMVTIEHFAGVEGRALVLPADEQVRLFVVGVGGDEN